ncbi:FLYWCH-type domain-containing protein [Aphis craccivora]|uniref:FLYWCH-type domain-containing protein n=1 Tax=Aphis craccivora TaxID=307492 RepID=A0A6G0ZFS3_APHCR|nr:FLYWCH-type domain-containing protein [Aphis craccivora]
MKFTLQNGVQRLPCCVKNCKYFIKLSLSNEIVESNTNHEHSEPDKKALNRQIMSNSLIRKALVDISCKPSKLIHSELKQGDIPTLTNNDLSLIRHNIHRARLSVHPSLPS